MMKIDNGLTAASLKPQIERVFEASAAKIKAIAATWDDTKGAPVFTVAGKYTSRGWTEWTHGFLFGSALLQFEATGDRWFLDYAQGKIRAHMPVHLSHVGVHDHGFNNVSTYGNLLRQARSGKVEAAGEREAWELALKVSGAVQAARWSRIHDGRGFIFSFNGPHSLFADTLRSLRSLALAHQLGHVLMSENDTRVSLLERWAQHASVTAEFNVYYGEGRDAYDVRGRVAHESIFNTRDGRYRCPSTQQGYSPFSTWTRGLAWILCGYAEQLEFLETRNEAELESAGPKAAVESLMRRAAEATADFYIHQAAASNGIPYWDTAAPGLARMPGWGANPADPANEYEPVDSSAAAVAAQGLLRLGNYLSGREGFAEKAKRYRQAALTIAKTLFSDAYFSSDAAHQGLILHSVYHRPNGWDYVPPGHRIPCGEATMWGDYHARELALLLLGESQCRPYITFFGI
jgi:unsaturated chondroitin disaccharide hydrolase